MSSKSQELTSNTPPRQSGSATSVPAPGPSAFQRLASFGKSKKATVVFPPPSWGLEEVETCTPEHQSRSTTPIPPSANADLEAGPTPEPATLAQTIRTLINALPPVPLSSSKGGDTPASTNVDPQGPPVPEGVDKKLMAWLSSEAVMNGYYAGKDSVFSTLDRLKRPLKKDGRPSDGTDQKSQEIDAADRVGVDGLMMYTPLVPANDSRVELADEDAELEYIDSEDLLPKPSTSEAKLDVDTSIGMSKSKSRFWRLGRDKGKASTTQQSADAPKTDSDVDSKLPKHVWVPSETNISVQVMWWGYRIYLPPPVMHSLDGGSIVATKRAAMVTTALKYMLDKIPTLMVPPTLRPALALFKRLAPYAGYIGVFIAWSWKSIKANDKGGGVTLTATWLMTVALIPSPWDVTPERRLVEPPTQPPDSKQPQGRK